MNYIIRYLNLNAESNHQLTDWLSCCGSVNLNLLANLLPIQNTEALEVLRNTYLTLSSAFRDQGGEDGILVIRSITTVSIMVFYMAMRHSSKVRCL